MALSNPQTPSTKQFPEDVPTGSPTRKDVNEDSAKGKKGKKKSKKKKVKQKQKPKTSLKAFLKKFLPSEVESMDIASLQQRLQDLNLQLEDYKKKASTIKKNNEWHREEIDERTRDTKEFITYLESKKSEKQTIIEDLNEVNRKDYEAYLAQKQEIERQYDLKIQDLQAIIIELDVKLESKNQEIHQLSDVVTKRTRHENEINRIRAEIESIDLKHRIKLSQVERKLLEERMLLQKEAEGKIEKMESEAQQQAAKYIQDYMKDLEQENGLLEKELRSTIQKTQNYLHRKEVLERQNRDLLREKQLREGLLKLRSSKVVLAAEKEKNIRKSKVKAQNEQLLLMKQKRLQEIWGKYQQENPPQQIQLDLQFDDSSDEEDDDLYL